MLQFFLSFSLIVFGVSVGYAVQRLVVARKIVLPMPLGQVRTSLQKISLLVFVPLSYFSTIWIVEIHDPSLFFFPFFELIAVILGGWLALLAARFFQHGSRQAGAMFTCGAFSNIGSLGGLVCFLFLGEPGYALMTFYKLLQPLTHYAIGFPVARSYSLSSGQNPKLSARTFVLHLQRDSFIQVALISIVVGAALNIGGVPRPAFFERLNAVLIPLSTVLLLASIGLALQFKRIQDFWRECAVISAIKFVCVPCCISLLAVLLGYREIDNAFPLQVIILLSSMPVAFNAMVASSIYELDLDVANSCFLFSTTVLLFMLPVLYLVIRLV